MSDIVFGALTRGPAGYSTHELTVASGATAGQHLLSMIGSNGMVEGASGENHEQQGRPLQPWLPLDSQPCFEPTICSESSPMELNVVLEDMLDVQGPWDQFEVNERRFGVKSTFDHKLSQYTTNLQVSKVSAEIKHKADCIASEIESEHQQNWHLDDDGYNCAAATTSIDDDDEEAKFSAVSRQLVQMQ